MKNILALCGSTRAQSTNHSLIQAIRAMTRESLNISIYQGIGDLPQYNPDLDYESPPTIIVDFRDQLSAADGILICTPEYAMGVPGSLKNAIDWTVSSAEFSHKPTALITASSMGQQGHESLIGTLKIIEADITDKTQLLISFAKTKIKNDAIIDMLTLQQVSELMGSFISQLNTLTLA